MRQQAEELVESRAEARQLADAQAALQAAFVQLQTEADCLRIRPAARHVILTGSHASARPAVYFRFPLIHCNNKARH